MHLFSLMIFAIDGINDTDDRENDRVPAPTEPGQLSAAQSLRRRRLSPKGPAMAPLSPCAGEASLVAIGHRGDKRLDN